MNIIISIAGQRGVGKTTAMIQYIYSFIQEDILSKQALYVPVDHFMVVGHSLYELQRSLLIMADRFYVLMKFTNIRTGQES
ncbi:hypothetical protein [Desulfobacula sp.]|uniref:hypothetical protein n=1 Tax=Desulfobacula sp. TaxID=2593537 RepID=UPI0026151E3A|nr:hypothetical protein [Desulfobacula sp.]